MRTIVIGDIHGCYNELVNLMQDLVDSDKYDLKTDRLIFLGDYIDRGDDSQKVIQYIRNLQKDNDNVIALKGNHEMMCVDFCRKTDDNWLFNGYTNTMESYKTDRKQFLNDVEWMEQLPLYYEDEHFIYVHAGVDANKPLAKHSSYELLWVRESFIYSVDKFEKTVIFGHTPSRAVTKGTKPYCTFADNVGIDTGCVFGGKLTALIIEDDKIQGFYQADKIKN
jgi:serine/threonine protein phosphatase 1